MTLANVIIMFIALFVIDKMSTSTVQASTPNKLDFNASQNEIIDTALTEQHKDVDLLTRFNPENVTFKVNSSELSQGGKEELNILGYFMQDEQYKVYSLDIVGHTDSIGSAQYNQNLSTARAKTIYDYLIATFDIKAEKLSYTGKGEEFPISSNSSYAGREKNRRVEFNLHK